MLVRSGRLAFLVVLGAVPLFLVILIGSTYAWTLGDGNAEMFHPNNTVKMAFDTLMSAEMHGGKAPAEPVLFTDTVLIGAKIYPDFLSDEGYLIYAGLSQEDRTRRQEDIGRVVVSETLSGPREYALYGVGDNRIPTNGVSANYFCTMSNETETTRVIRCVGGEVPKSDRPSVVTTRALRIEIPINAAKPANISTWCPDNATIKLHRTEAYSICGWIAKTVEAPGVNPMSRKIYGRYDLDVLGFGPDSLPNGSQFNVLRAPGSHRIHYERGVGEIYDPAMFDETRDFGDPKPGPSSLFSNPAEITMRVFKENTLEKERRGRRFNMINVSYLKDRIGGAFLDMAYRLKTTGDLILVGRDRDGGQVKKYVAVGFDNTSGEIIGIKSLGASEVGTSPDPYRETAEAFVTQFMFAGEKIEKVSMPRPSPYVIETLGNVKAVEEKYGVSISDGAVRALIRRYGPDAKKIADHYAELKKAYGDNPSYQGKAGEEAVRALWQEHDPGKFERPIEWVLWQDAWNLLLGDVVRRGAIGEEPLTWRFGKITVKADRDAQFGYVVSLDGEKTFNPVKPDFSVRLSDGNRLAYAYMAIAGGTRPNANLQWIKDYGDQRTLADKIKGREKRLLLVRLNLPKNKHEIDQARKNWGRMISATGN